MARFVITVTTEVEQCAYIEAQTEFDALNAAHRDYMRHINDQPSSLNWSQPTSYNATSFRVEDCIADEDDDDFLA